MSDPYADLADPFARHYATLRGQVREVLAARQLAAHAPAPPAAVADIGGGAGQQAIRLARLGHEVVLLDPSARMLALAREALGQEAAAVRARARLVQGYGEDAPQLLGSEAFDLVLCHGVITYLDEPRPLIAALGRIAKPGGIVSLITKNAEALAVRPALEGRFREARRAFAADGAVGGMGVATRAHSLAQLVDWVAAAGLELAGWYGIRVFTDHLGRQPPGGDVADVLAAEWEAGRRDPYRRVARLLHVLARRRPAGP